MLIAQFIAAVAAGALLAVITMAVTAIVVLMIVRPVPRHSAGSVAKTPTSRTHKARHRAIAMGAAQ